MSVSRRCGVCQELHLVTRDGVMSIHTNATGERCAGSVGQAPRRAVRTGNQRTLTGSGVRIGSNQPPLSDQWIECPACSFRVPVTIYGRVAQHQVQDARISRRGSVSRRTACPGAGLTLDRAQLTFEPAKRSRAGDRPKATIVPAPPVSVEPNQPPFSGQQIECGSCSHRVPITIYGRIARHTVRAQAGAKPGGRGGLCGGSDADVDRSVLRFAVSEPPVKVTSGPLPPKQQVTCARCGVTFAHRGDGPLRAHQRPSGLWCKGGVKPTEADRAKSKRGKKRSVWAVGGGLPTLGKGHR